MVKLLYVFTFISQQDPDLSYASSYARQAILQTSEMKAEIKIIKNSAETLLYTHTGISPKDLAYLGYVYPLLSGKISTSNFKNFKYKTDSTELTPAFDYSFNDQSYSAGVFFSYRF